jgi:F-type H+-transporting ATPase subunit c
MSLKSKLSLSAVVATALVLFPALALAQEGAASNKSDVQSWLAASAGFAIGIAALGGTMGQSRAAAAALEGISRNPGAAARIQTPMILGRRSSSRWCCCPGSSRSSSRAKSSSEGTANAASRPM